MSSTSSVLGTCRLCRKEAVALCSSHLLPAAIPRWISMSNRATGTSKGAIYVTKKTVVQKDYRIADYLLCRNCEDRFNFGGEKWLLANTYRGSGKFPLQAALQAASRDGRPLIPLQQATIVPAAATPGIELPKLLYFAASVFWRAAAHSWNQIDRRIQIALGPYEERLRCFLLAEEPFPDNAALLINVGDEASPNMSAIYPYSDRVRGVWQHRFAIPGMAFWLHLGRIPNAMFSMCAARAGTLCLAKNLDDNLVLQGTRLFRVNPAARTFQAR